MPRRPLESKEWEILKASKKPPKVMPEWENLSEVTRIILARRPLEPKEWEAPKASKSPPEVMVT